MAKGRKLFKPNEGVLFPGAGQLSAVAASVSNKSRNNKKPHQKKEKTDAKVSFKMNKKLGQHLLKNPGIVTKIIEAANIKSSDVVLEIGPGTGNLTVQLCGLARKVVALEIDPRMVAEVKKRCLMKGYNNFDIKSGDALKSDFGEFHVCTANLPYQISSPFIFRLVAHPHPFRCAVLMFQKEFGERLIAQPGEKLYCRLSVNTQIFCKVTRVCHVSAASFNPPPKVDSVVVKLTPTKEHKIADYAQWDGMLRILFSRKNRTIQAALKKKNTARSLIKIAQALRLLRGEAVEDTLSETEQIANYREAVEQTLAELDFQKKRAIQMSIVEFQQLQHALHKRGIYFVQNSSTTQIPKSFFDANMDDEADDNASDDDDEMDD